MKRKALAIILVIVLTLAVALPTIAATKGATTSGVLSIKKVVEKNGEKITFEEWLEKYAPDDADIIGGMGFELFSAPDASVKIGDDAVPDATGVIDADGEIVFDPEVSAGWYVIREVLSGAAADIFLKQADMRVYFNGLSVTGGSSDFNYSALYTIVNGYGGPGSRTLGYPGLNNNGDLFYIGVTDTISGEEYASYCAHAGSKNFAGDNQLGCSGYMVAESQMKDEPDAQDFDNFIYALNWIEDNYSGSLGSTDHTTSSARAVAQTVIWALLGAVDVDSEAFEATNLTQAEKDAVRDALEAAENKYLVGDTIIDLVYMICENHDHDFEYCQPQLVPVYSGVPSFTNKLRTTGDLKIIKRFSGIPEGAVPSEWNARFTVAVNGKTLTKTYSDFTVDSSGDLSWIIKDLPVGVNYVVRETGGEVPGYTWLATGNQVIVNGVIENRQTTVATVTNSYTTEELPGSLIITKEFRGITGDEIPKEFDATFTVTGPENFEPYTKDYSEFDVDNDGNRYWLLDNLDVGETYTVTETNGGIPGLIWNAGGDKVVVEKAIVAGRNSVVITNSYTEWEEPTSYTLTVSAQKRVTGNSPPSGAAFTFLLTLTTNDYEGNVYVDDSTAPLDGFTGTYTQEKQVTGGGTVTWKFKFDSKVTVDYTVEEIRTAIPANFTYINIEKYTDGEWRQFDGFEAEGHRNIDGSYREEYRITNGYSYREIIPEYGSLRIVKVFTGAVTSPPAGWNATFTVTGPGGFSRIINYSSFTSGSYTINNLNPGVYTVTESGGGIAGYTQTVTISGPGTVTVGGTAVITVTNDYEEEPPPPPPPPEDELIELPPDDVPTTDFPPDPPKEDEVIIVDDTPPLDELPQTGKSIAYMGFLVLGVMMVVLGTTAQVLENKKLHKH